MASAAAVPVGFHYETKFVVLSYLGLLSRGPLHRQRLSSAPAFPSTGFDRHTSPVFSPANPESSVEDCLAHLGERVSRELQEPLQKALQALLSQPVTYQAYRECTLQTTVHASGWDKVLVPLVLLQQMLSELTRRGQEPLGALLQFGVTYLEDHAADFIVQQGGWGTVFNLESEEEEEDPGVVAEDSNDIYILPSDNSGQVSPPESPTVTTSWQSESLPVSLGPESWQQVAVDPEEVRSLDSSGAGEKSENNSSNSDIVHVEREEVPEGAGEAAEAPGVLPAGGLQEAFQEDPAPSLPRVTATSLPQMREPAKVTAVERVSLAPSLAGEPGEAERQVVPALEPGGALRSEGTEARGERLLPGPSLTGEEGALPPARGTTTLLFGGAAAVAALVVAVGVALALRKK
ncbi:bcl-2-like protein 13 isoform X2 [Sturnira hondurensis]|uniref:bcl-2-like protein 13 isoform X2 n=1 Tax=Sturnira hondurensis TaxID=192404 RepID=UPI00187ADBE9|nr:bcl-2-like protein 13 isoform X2 [Sturnira hondurensis]